MPPARKTPEVAVRLAGQVAAVLGEPPARRLPLVLRLAFVLHAESRGLVPAGVRDMRTRQLLALLERVFADSGLLALRSPVAEREVQDLVAALGVLDGVPVDYRALDIEDLGGVHESLLCEDSRRRSGSHYTPRTLTAPVVRTALAPVLAALGERPTAEQVLAIKICDPAMGAGAFLLEACRQLAELLVRITGMTEAAARREVARHCLHGVDKDPVAVDLAKLSLWLLVAETDTPLTFLDRNFKSGDSLHPFAWAREFPGVFARDNPGFDVVVGNPPFMGGVRISGATSPEYLKAITAKFPGTGGQADLVAYFFRHAFNSLRNGGALGLLATNTISQGATRKASLQAIVRAGGQIYAAERRVPWAGPAAVMASAVWIIKGRCPGPCLLDGVPHAKITAFLVPHGSSEDPQRLAANLGVAFKGIEPYGDGFVFEDGNPNANTLTTLARVRKDRANHARIFSYLGGEELNRSPTQSASRYIIDFDEMTLAEAGRWPQLLNIVRRRVKPERASKAADVARWPWWQYWRTRPELRRATRGLARVLALADTSKHLSLAFVPTRQLLLNKTLVIVALAEFAAFAVLQSRVHEVWARFFGSSMKADLRYTARDVFETFPFPPEWRTNAALERAGEAYHRVRGECMVAAVQGLTTTYNRFHDPGEMAPEVQQLRELHAGIDRVVLAAYGWTDLDAACEFSGAPVRLRWSQAVQDQVLARLLDLNHRSAGPR